jgi:hypothetical protein
MTQASEEKATNFASPPPTEPEAEHAVGKTPADRGKTPTWRLDLEPRRLIAQGRAYVSAIAYGGE